MRNQPTFLHDVHIFSGSPYEIGYQRGKLTAERVKKALANLTFGNPYLHDEWPKPKDYNLDHFRKNFPRQFKKYEKALEKTPEWFREEARGQADGAGVPYEKLIIASTWFPFVMGGDSLAASANPLEDDCNGFIAHGKATKDGNPMVGGNGETDHLAIKGQRVVHMKNKVGNNFVMEAKYPVLNSCQAGMNEKGVCLFGSGVSIKPEVWGDIGYRIIIRRIVLQEANNIDEAIDLFKQGPLMGGQHIYLADPKRAVHIEYTGKRVEVIDPESGFDAGSSPYFSSPNMTPSCNVLVDETDPHFSYMTAKKRGVFRMERWHELFNQKKPISIEDIPSMAGDHGGRGSGIIQESIEGACPQGSDYTICAHGKPSHGRGGTSGTVGSFHASSFSNISQPSERKFWLAFGNPCEAGYVPFKPPK